MNNYCIFVVSPPGYVHSHTFDELAISFQEAFHQLGITAPIVNDPKEIKGCPIVFGANLLPFNPLISIPPESIIYNLEQVTIGSSWFNMNYINLLKNYKVWDYSTNNLTELMKLGIINASFCGIGYSPCLTKIKPVAHQDIDVLLYGSSNERRTTILQELKNRGFNAGILFNSYGEERDSWIARSKIIINIHFYESKVFEIVRVSYLLANRIFVVSETGSDGELEKPFEGGIVLTPYESLVDVCIRYLTDEVSRTKIANLGFQLFEKLSQTTMLEAALKTLN